MKTLLFLALVIFGSHVLADDLRWNCFVSTGKSKPIHLAFSFGDGKSTNAFVRYKSGNGVILLKQIRSESIEMAEGRPYEYTYEFIEDFNGVRGGTYKIIVQGAIFYGFTFKTKNGDKEYQFEMDVNSENEQGCDWY